MDTSVQNRSNHATPVSTRLYLRGTCSPVFFIRILIPEDLGTVFENVKSSGDPGDRLNWRVPEVQLVGVTIVHMLQIHSTRYLVSRVSDRGGEVGGGWF